MLMRVGKRCLRQRRETQRNLLCCPASVNHGGQQRLTDRIWSSGRDPQPRPRPRQSVCLSESEVALHTPTGPDEPLDLSAPDALFVFMCIYVCAHVSLLLVHTTPTAIKAMTYFLCLFDVNSGYTAPHDAPIAAHKQWSHADRC